MPVGRMQVTMGADSGFPRDKLTNVLHFEADDVWFGDPTNWGALAQDLLDAYQAGWLGAAAREITVKAYALADELPRTPRAVKVENANAFPASNVPREISLCLSFRGDSTSPRARGRIYLPVCVTDFTAGTVRPNTTIRQKAMDMGPRFAGLGGLNVDWVIWSTTDRRTVEVKHTWVDDEWDIQRSRGMRPTARLEANVGP